MLSKFQDTESKLNLVLIDTNEDNVDLYGDPTGDYGDGGVLLGNDGIFTMV